MPKTSELLNLLQELENVERLVTSVLMLKQSGEYVSPFVELNFNNIKARLDFVFYHLYSLYTENQDVVFKDPDTGFEVKGVDLISNLIVLLFYKTFLKISLSGNGLMEVSANVLNIMDNPTNGVASSITKLIKLLENVDLNK